MVPLDIDHLNAAEAPVSFVLDISLFSNIDTSFKLRRAPL